MRQPYAHDAILDIGKDEDTGAAGAAITTQLCGYVDHEGPCPLAPHYTSVARDGDRLRVRVLFAVEPASEAEVRRRIVEALSAGHGTASSGDSVKWSLRHDAVHDLTPPEFEHATRLAQGP
jgi:hypothetical protein